jgi:uncharacterized protein (TIGR00730 family)
MKRICVFCGSNRGNLPSYEEAARSLAKTLARHQMGLVFGGGQVGLMGVIADAMLAEKGEVLGVIPRALFKKEVAHGGLTRLYEVDSMHERKQLMYDLSDGFIALPGGWGTLDELCEIVTWSQLGLHQKPCGLLNTVGFFDSLLQFLNDCTQKEFIRPSHRDLFIVETSPEALLEKMKAHRPIPSQKWIEEEST